MDGVIAALHIHAGTALSDVAQRVRDQLSAASLGRISALLVDGESAVLGRRRLSHGSALGGTVCRVKARNSAMLPSRDTTAKVKVTATTTL